MQTLNTIKVTIVPELRGLIARAPGIDPETLATAIRSSLHNAPTTRRRRAGYVEVTVAGDAVTIRTTGDLDNDAEWEVLRQVQRDLVRGRFNAAHFLRGYGHDALTFDYDPAAAAA